MSRVVKVGGQVIDLLRQPTPAASDGIATGALYFGPEADSTRYYSADLGSTPTGDFALVTVYRPGALYRGGQPSSSYSGAVGVAQNFASGGFGSGGGDCYLWHFPLNHGTAGNRGKIAAKLSQGGVNVLASGTSLLGTSTIGNEDPVVVVLQSNAGTIELKTCRPGQATVTEASGARNGSFGARALGTWRLGASDFAGTMQAFAFIEEALSDADIAQIAAGADLTTVVSAPARRLLWQLDTADASIPAKWGSTPLTRAGTWSTERVVSPVLPAQDVRIDVTSEPVPYGAVTINDDGTDPAWTIIGTVTGYTPRLPLQARLVDDDGVAVTAWTTLGSWTETDGDWSGTLTVPAGGLYRLQVRDRVSPDLTWLGAHPFNVCPVIVSVGQSPMAYLDSSFTATDPLTAPLFWVHAGYGQVIKATDSNTSAGMVGTANAFHAASGLPLVAVLGAVGGTSLAQWAAKDALVWPRLVTALTYLAPERILPTWLNGAAEGSTTIAEIKTRLTTILGNLRELAAVDRLRVIPHNRDTGNTTSNHKTRRGQIEWVDENPTDALLGPSWLDMQTEGDATGVTNPHPDLVGVERFAPRFGQDTAAAFGLAATSGRGPRPASAVRNSDGTVIDVTFTHTHGTALLTPNGGTTATGVAGFEVSNNGFSSTLTISLAVITGASTVRLTLASPPSNMAALVVRYGGSEPVSPALYNAAGGGLGDLLYDNSGVAPTGGLPAYPSTADLTVAAP